jgi:pantoate kinase
MHVYSPSSITAFFEIEENGSRGVSISLDKGVTTRVSDGDGIFFNGKKIENSIQQTVLDVMNKSARIETFSELPVSQGFGVSAGAGLSTAYALNEFYNFNKSDLELAKIVHEIEIKKRTGLGDICAQFYGGVLWRQKPGFQEVTKMLFEDRIIIAVVGNPIVTKDVIENRKNIETINKAGRLCFSKMFPEISFKDIIRLGRKFSEDSGLVVGQVKSALQDGDKYGTVSMAMLGNTVYGIGNIEKLSEVWYDYGKVFVLAIDENGARVVK